MAIAFSKALAADAYSYLVGKNILTSQQPTSDADLQHILALAETSPATADWKHPAIEVLRSTGFEGLKQGLVATSLAKAANASRFENIISGHPLFAGVAATNAPAAPQAPVNARRSPLLAGIPRPSEIVKGLDQYVWGQSEAKLVTANAVYAHYARLAIIDDCKKRGVELPDDLDEKANVMFVGPTGTGKTLIAQTIAKMLDIPFAIADATSVTEAGYVGDDVETIILKLLQAADGDVEKAQRGIIFVDEIDKKRKPEGESASITKDVSGAGVQQALLKMLEGQVVRVPPQGGRKNPMGGMIEVDTTNILFMSGGAFTGIANLYAAAKKQTEGDTSKPSIGFGATVGKKVEETGPDLAEVYANIDPELLIKFGMMPEFMGRFPVIAGLHPLSTDDLKRIITEPKNAVGKQFAQRFRREGVELDIDDAGLTALAQKAQERAIGGRGLKAIFEDVFKKTLFALPDSQDVVGCKVGGDLKPELVTEKSA